MLMSGLLSIMRLKLLDPRNRGLSFITPWLLKRSELPFSPPSSANQTASLRTAQIEIMKTRGYPQTILDNALNFADHVLLDGEVLESKAVSPLSFLIVLSFLAAASSGSTGRHQLVRLLGAGSVNNLNLLANRIHGSMLADGDPFVGPRIGCSSALWADHSLSPNLNPSFQHILTAHYNAPVHPVDFHTQAPHVRQQINSWVENKTSSLIKDLIREVSFNNSPQLIFSNALYFKGSWHDWSILSSSYKRDCNSHNEARTSAGFMVVSRKEFSSFSGFSMCNLPFKTQKGDDGRSFMLHFDYPVPYDGEAMHTETKMDACGLQLMAPKFNISSEVEASNVLRQLGATLPFSGGGKFTEMFSSFDGQNMHVIRIFQKSFIDINEQGTEAATATVVALGFGCPPDLPHVPTPNLLAPFSKFRPVGNNYYAREKMARAILPVRQTIQLLSG